ncbi:YdcF family protein [Saccharopolyspora erythraea]|uniref:YdcF family protein n=1 Tax=Saccharopolyspora erythraea TaxID=1836 RepID=UPI001BAA164C|nr:YdcF family protein [Saccharopolyspora erythraea]QUH02260.1 YdcF family protein [Saccharopolyspora erythraea]
MLFFGVAGVFLLLFLVTFLYDRRLVRNGLYLFLALVFLAGGVLVELSSYSEWAASVLLLMLLLTIPLITLVLAGFLIVNGVTMMRREGRRPANLLSLAAGLGIIGIVAVKALANITRWLPLQVAVEAVSDVLAYVSLLFVCFLLYSFVYGRIRHRHDVDFIVVLGSGLIGSRVPPLLASRLDRGRTAFEAEESKGRHPVLVTSGGQGPGEDLPEARAMADYLISHGVPEDRILVEDQSRSTEENLRFSKALMQERRPDYRCLVVTNSFHVMRAARIARGEKVNAQVIGSRTARYFLPSATIREFVAVFLAHRVVNIGVCLLLASTSVVSAL